MHRERLEINRREHKKEEAAAAEKEKKNERRRNINAFSTNCRRWRAAFLCLLGESIHQIFPSLL
jgi:hypothetical protein